MVIQVVYVEISFDNVSGRVAHGGSKLWAGDELAEALWTPSF